MTPEAPTPPTTAPSASSMTRTLNETGTRALLGRLGAAFGERGHDLYLVGGTVRDALLGRPTKDIDLTTDAHPDVIKQLVAELRPDGIYAVGERFGTIGAIFDGLRLETTTYRSEVYLPYSRHPEVSFGTTLLGDLARRDFTINAMARRVIGGELSDPFGGQSDLAARTVRAVGQPDERFTEDPLRLLRAVRFCAQLGFELEPETRRAARQNASSIRHISRERVFDELNQILITERPSRGLRLLADLGLADELLPDLVALRRIGAGRRMKDVFAHTLAVVDRTPPDLVLRWSALLHDVGKAKTVSYQGDEIHFPGHEIASEQMARQLLPRLRMDQHSTERVARLVGLHMRANQYEEDWTDGAVRRLIRHIGDDLDLLFQLSTADVTSYRAEKIEAATARVSRLRERCARIQEEEDAKALKSPLDGTDLMEMFGRGPGPWIKQIKQYLLDLVIEGALSQEDRATASALARRRVKDLEAPAEAAGGEGAE